MHLRGLMQYTGMSSATTQRELARLTEAGVLTREEVGRVVLYKPNTRSPIYRELNSIMRKTEGVAELLKDALRPFENRIERAFIFGSVAKSEDIAASDIDLFVLGRNIGSADLYTVLVQVEQKLGRKVSLTVYRPAELKLKLLEKNHFLTSVMKGPKLNLIGEGDDE